MDITELRTETAEWDAFVRASGEGSPFQLVAWKRAVERTFGLRAHYLMARENGRLVGVLPLFEARELFGRRALISVPYAVYGGICATSDAARRALVDAATVLGRKRRAAYVELRQRRDLELGLTVKQRYVAFARSISKDEEENALAIPRKQRRMIRQGPKYGLRSAAERRHLDSVYDVYAQSVHNLGSPGFPRRLFHALAEAFEEDCHVLALYHDAARRTPSQPKVRRGHRPPEAAPASRDQWAGADERPVSARTMRILMLAHRLPYPPTTGARVRAFHVAQALAGRHQLTLACPLDGRRELAAARELRTLVPDLECTVLPSLRRQASALAALAGGLPLSVRYFTSRALAARIRQRAVAERFDVTYVSSSSMAQYAPPGVPLVMDFVDVDSEKFARYGRETQPLMRWIYRLVAERLRRDGGAGAARARGSGVVDPAG